MRPGVSGRACQASKGLMGKQVKKLTRKQKILMSRRTEKDLKGKNDTEIRRIVEKCAREKHLKS